MSLILNRLGLNFVSRGLGGGDVDLIEQCEIISFGIDNEVIVNKHSYPLTGTLKSVPGWTWNKTKPQNLKNIKERIESNLGGHKFNLEEGSIEKHWFGSVLSGISLKEISEIQSNGKRKIWIPKYTPGVYSIYHFNKRLFSNRSTCEILNTEEVNDEGNFLYEIKNKCIDSSISISLFKRDSKFNNIPVFNYKYQNELNDEFTYRLNEDNKIEFKNLKLIKIGSEEITENLTIEELQCKYEHLGLGNRYRGICYTEYFPIQNVNLKTIKNDLIYEWTEVNSFENSNEEERHFIVDKETGKIIFSNEKKEIFFTVKKDLGGVIELHEDTKEFPEKCKAKIMGEDVYIYAKKKYGVYVCKEDFSEREALHEEGAVGSIKKGGKHLTNLEQIYVAYEAAPRIDFECIKDGTFYTDLNIKPYTKINSNGIIEVSPQEKHVQSIELTCDKPVIGANLYGPIFLQGDTSIIKAKVLNGNEKAVSEVDVTFKGAEGSFEGDVPAERGIKKVTNRDGEAKTAYYYPYSNNALSGYSNLTIEGNNCFLTYNNLGIGTKKEDIAIFQVYKTDSYSGSLGKKFKVLNKKIVDLDNRLMLEIELPLGDSLKEYELNQLDRSIDIENYVPRDLGLCNAKELNTGMCLIELDYNLGTVGPVMIEKVLGENKIQIFAKRWEYRKIKNLNIKCIHLYKRAELDWSGLGEPGLINNEIILNRSLNKILYTIDEETGFYKKVTPDRIVNNRIYFDNIHLPMNSMSDRNNVIASYKIMASKNIKLQASCIDPATGFEIRSNEIKLKVDFPNYLKSEDGFRFKTLLSEDSGGLGGANFIAINPNEHTNQINLHFLD